MRLAAALRKARVNSGLSREDLAKKLAVAPARIAEWEGGLVTPPRYRIDDIVNAYGIGLEFEWMTDVDTNVDHTTRLPRLPPKNKSCIYFIEAAGLDAIKIGVSSSPLERLWSLQDASPAELNIVYWVAGVRTHEQAIHREMADSHIRGEWFTASGLVRELIKKLAAMSPDDAATYVNGLVSEKAA